MPPHGIGSRPSPDLSRLSISSADAEGALTPGAEYRVPVTERQIADGTVERGVVIKRTFYRVTLPQSVATGEDVIVRASSDGSTVAFVQRAGSATPVQGELAQILATGIPPVAENRALFNILKSIAELPQKLALNEHDLPVEVRTRFEEALNRRGIVSGRMLTNREALTNLLASRFENRPELPLSTSSGGTGDARIRTPLRAAILMLEQIAQGAPNVPGRGQDSMPTSSPAQTAAPVTSRPTPEARPSRAERGSPPSGEHTAENEAARSGPSQPVTRSNETARASALSLTPHLKTAELTIDQLRETPGFDHHVAAHVARIEGAEQRLMKLCSESLPRSPLHAIERVIEAALKLSRPKDGLGEEVEQFLKEFQRRLVAAQEQHAGSSDTRNLLNWAQSELSSRFGIDMRRPPYSANISPAVPSPLLAPAERAALKLLATQIEIALSQRDPAQWDEVSAALSPRSIAALLPVLDQTIDALRNSRSPAVLKTRDLLRDLREQLSGTESGNTRMDLDEIGTNIRSLLEVEDFAPRHGVEPLANLVTVVPTTPFSNTAPPRSSVHPNEGAILRAIEASLRLLTIDASERGQSSRSSHDDPFTTLTRSLATLIDSHSTATSIRPALLQSLHALLEAPSSEGPFDQSLGMIEQRRDAVLTMISMLDQLALETDSESIPVLPVIREFLTLVQTLDRGRTLKGDDSALIRSLLSALIQASEQIDGAEELRINEWAHETLQDFERMTSDRSAPQNVARLALDRARARLGAHADSRIELHDILPAKAAESVEKITQSGAHLTVRSGDALEVGSLRACVIPLVIGGVMTHAELLFARDSTGRGQQQDADQQHPNRELYERFQLWIALPALGTISIDGAFRTAELFLTMGCEKPEIAEFIRGRLSSFKNTLSSLGFADHHLTVNERVTPLFTALAKIRNDHHHMTIA